MASPLDDIRALAQTLPSPDVAAADNVRRRLEAEGVSEALIDMAAWLAAWPAGSGPDHSEGRRGVRRPILSLYISSSETVAEAPARARVRLETLSSGGGAVSMLARSLGAGVEIFDLGLDRPAPDPLDRPVMTERECAATIAFGMESLAKSPDLLILSDLTEGADGAAERLVRALDGDKADLPTRMADSDGNALQALRQLGGREVAAITGAILAARVQGVPVLLDGLAAQAAAAVCDALNPAALAHVRLAHDAPAAPLHLASILSTPMGSGGQGGLAALALVKLAGEL